MGPIPHGEMEIKSFKGVGTPNVYKIVTTHLILQKYYYYEGYNQFTEVELFLREWSYVCPRVGNISVQTYMNNQFPSHQGEWDQNQTNFHKIEFICPKSPDMMVFSYTLEKTW